MNEVFKSWKPQCVSRVAGAGNKAVHLIDQKSDVYLNLIPGIKNWDFCAGEALLQAMKAIVCDSDHKPLIYNSKATDYTIANGIFVCKNRKVFDICNQRMIENSGKDLPTFQTQMNADTEKRKQQKAAEAAKKKAEEEAKGGAAKKVSA